MQTHSVNEALWILQNLKLHIDVNTALIFVHLSVDHTWLDPVKDGRYTNHEAAEIWAGERERHQAGGADNKVRSQTGNGEFRSEGTNTAAGYVNFSFKGSKSENESDVRFQMGSWRI